MNNIITKLNELQAQFVEAKSQRIGSYEAEVNYLKESLTFLNSMQYFDILMSKYEASKGQELLDVEMGLAYEIQVLECELQHTASAMIEVVCCYADIVTEIAEVNKALDCEHVENQLLKDDYKSIDSYSLSEKRALRRCQRSWKEHRGTQYK